MKIKKFLATTILTGVIASSTIIPAFAISNAAVSDSQTGSNTVICDESTHGKFAKGHSTYVNKTYSGMRTWGLARVTNNNNNQVTAGVYIGGKYKGESYGTKQVTTSTFSEWGKEAVSAKHW